MTDIPSSTWFTVAPHWQWLIVFYFFFGGLAGGSYFLAALADFFGRAEDRPLARLGYYIALPCIVFCGLLLIVDLSRPDRFWHILLENHTLRPTFKYWSPMSIGSWMLLGFGFFSLLSFLGALAESDRLRWKGARRLRPPGTMGRAIAATGALFGLYVAGYTGVLLAVTNRPIWSDTPLLGMLFVISATSISAALMTLLARRRLPGTRTLQRIDTWAIALVLLVLIGVVVSLGPVARAWLNAWGVLLVFGVVVLGLLVPLLLRWRTDWLGERNAAAAAVLVLVGGFLLRTVIVLSSEGVKL